MENSYRLSNELLDGKFKPATTEVLIDGAMTNRRMSAVDAKIIRACVSKMQKKHSNLKIQEIESRALEELKEEFVKNNIPIEGEFDPFKGEFVFEKKHEIRDVAISQKAREILKNEIDTEYEFHVDEIAELTAIGSNNVSYIRQRLKQLQVKSAYEIEEYFVDESFSSIEKEMVDVVLVPTIRTRRGKVKFEVNSSAIPYLFALSRNYTKSENLAIARLTSNYAIIFYEHLKKIYKIQENIRYSFEQLQSKFGTNYKRYAEFKKNILNEVIRNINEKTSMYVELKEYKEGRKVVGIGFAITLENADAKPLSYEDTLARYVTASKFFASNQKMTLVEYKEEKEHVKALIERKALPGMEIIVPAFKANQEALEETESFLEAYQLGDVFEIDWMRLTLRRSSDNSFVAPSAPEALKVLKAQYMQSEEVETEPVESSYSSLSLFEPSLEAAEYFSRKITERNPHAKVDAQKWASDFEKTVETYGIEVVYQVIDWLFGKEGEFYLQHINSAAKFAAKFEDLLHKVNVTSRKSAGYQGNIFDLYEGK